jgi:hypothetical protein
MDEAASRRLMCVELLVFLAPVTLVEFSFASAFADLFFLKGVSLWLFAGPVAIALSPLFVLWCLAIVFSLRGTARLRRVSQVWWFLATAGAGIPLIGISALLVEWALGGAFMDAHNDYILGEDGDPYGVRFATVAAGWALQKAALTTPLLVALIHLWWERSRSHAL